LIQQTSLDMFVYLQDSLLILSYSKLVFGFLKSVGFFGVTGYEISKATGINILNVRPRLTELKKAGLIAPVGRRDNQIVWGVV